MPVKITGIDMVIRKLGVWEEKKLKGIQTLMTQEAAPMLEDYMKSNRPWTDRTGNARRGLKVVSSVSTAEIVLQLWHSVYYGIFLEACQAGKYAILNPTLQNKKITVYNMIDKYWRE